MEIIEYFACDRQAHWLSQIGKSDWDAGQYLHQLLSDGTFDDMAGTGGRIMLLTDGDELVSYCTYTKQDDIRPTELGPWIGFVYTFPQYRGHRHVGKLIAHVEALAATENVHDLYISTGHTGLYEKYGYAFDQSLPDVHGNPARVYHKHIG